MAEDSSSKRMPAADASLEAQRIALAPIVFQAARLLRDLGILQALRSQPGGMTLDELDGVVETSRYGVLILLEAGLAAGLVRVDGTRYFLMPPGVFILRDELTRINMDFVHDCCFQASHFLEDAIREGKPVGLNEVFGDWETIYPALCDLPEPARTSWFNFDHYYSDAAFPDALPIVFERKHRTLLDVGGNTGRWAFRCVDYSPEVSVTVLDLPRFVGIVEAAAEERGLRGRISTHPTNVLDSSGSWPEGFDAIWMSQFLVCFAEEEVTRLLQSAADVMSDKTTLYVLDNFWDRQASLAGAYCLQTFSMYFAFLANGYSRMYKASDIIEMAGVAGLEVERVVDDLGVCSSLLICRRR